MHANHPPPIWSSSTIAVDRTAMFFMSFPIVCFTLALLTDVAYWRTSFLMWHDFSAWLLLAGAVGCGVALIIGVVGLFFRPRIRSWLYWMGVLVVLALGVANNLVHAGDGWTAIVPTGIALSAVTVVALIVTGWIGRSTVANAGVHRHV